MKNQYVGDVNDFAKYGLLNWLTSSRASSLGLRLGLVWYLTGDIANRDGNRIQYLGRPRPNVYSAADEALLERLAPIVRDGPRHISQIQERQILPSDTAFFSPPVPSVNREGWFDDAMGATDGCDLVFLDPDKGLVMGAAGAPRSAYATFREVHKLYTRGQSVIVIQFLHRLRPHDTQLRSWTLDLASILPHGAPPPFALRWRSGTSLGFLVVPNAVHAATMRERTRDLLLSPWGALFDRRPII